MYAAETAYLIQCDRNGILRMHNPRTGEVLTEVDLGSRVDATPAVFNNMLVVGTRGSGGSGEGQKNHRRTYRLSSQNSIAASSSPVP